MNSPTNHIVAIFGGTGHYGRKITEKLLNKGITTRVLSRNRIMARKIIGDKPEIIEGNVNEKQKVAAVLEGSESVIISISAMNWKQIRKIQEIEVGGLKTILEESTRLGIKRLLFISVYDINELFVKEQKSEKLADTKAISERLIRESNFNWTILGCPPSYELFFRLLRNGSLNVPGGGRKPIVCISSDDVGEIAAQAILRNDLGGKRFRLAGPEIISFPAFAQRVSSITGKPIRHRAIPLELINGFTMIVSLINPFPRMIYKAISLMNNFPADIADQTLMDHKLLINTFSFIPTTMSDEIRKRYKR